MNDIDINEIVVSNKFPFGKKEFKYFTGYKDNKEIIYLCIFFPKMSIYILIRLNVLFYDKRSKKF